MGRDVGDRPFTWPFYLFALLVLVNGVGGSFAGGVIMLCSGLIVLGCLWFLVGSLGVSHWVHDRSDLYRFIWLGRALRNNYPKHILLCHSGFDEALAMLKPLFPTAQWTVLDHFDPTTMTEASIRRARKLYPPAPGTIAAKTQNVVFGLLAVHELRTVTERADWFREAGRCLAAEGCVVLVEHVRNLANFAAFGPGFLHFHSVVSWRNSWEPAGLTQSDQFHVTPFIRVFVMTPK